VLRSWRWSVVAALVAVLCATPGVVSHLPFRHSAMGAAALLARIQAPGNVAYSGYAESSGGLGLPVSTQFSSIADLFGGTTQMRVWSLDDTHWRVDAVSLTGESDVHQLGTSTWTWNYESNQATLIREPQPPAVRLPVAGDLLPTTLARRLLSEATPPEVHRIGDMRIAGHDAAGLRLVPSDSASTIDHVDVWADPNNGLALRVDVYGAGSTVVSTRFLDLSTATPPVADIGFIPAPATQRRVTGDVDIASFINRLGLAKPPTSLAGFLRNTATPGLGSIGIYGRGVAEFAAAPLFGRTAGSLRHQLSSTVGVTTSAAGQSVTVGPLSLVLTPDTPGNGPGQGLEWLLVGTVSQRALTTAAAELLASGP
jgi:hypothetical protein